MIDDLEHWHNLKPPLSPNEYEISLYKKLIGDSSPVCLLGMTKELVNLCDVAIDIHPINIGKPTICDNWENISGTFGAVIGDGIPNLTGLDYVKKVLSVSEKFICRVFMKKQIGMKYATLFLTEFPDNSYLEVTQQDIAMVMWKK